MKQVVDEATQIRAVYLVLKATIELLVASQPPPDAPQPAPVDEQPEKVQE